MYTEADFPAGALQLSGELTAALERALDHPALRALSAAYPACMAQRGYPQAQSRHALKAQILERDFAPLSPNGQPVAQDDPRLATAHAAEVSAATADAACRADSYPMALTLAGPALEAFETDHAARLTAIDSGWAAKRAQADADRKKIDW